VTSSITCPFDAPYTCSISYTFPIVNAIVTDSLSPAVIEIFASKYIRVTTLTFWGHVTSSVTWPFDSPYPISYSCSIVTKALSPALFEILGSKVSSCKSSLRMRDITWPVPLCKIWAYIWISHPHIAYSLWHFYWAPMKNNGCLLVRPLMLNAKSSENFPSPDQNGANFGGFGGLGSGVLNSFDFYSKRHICAWIHVVRAILRQNRSRGVTSRSVREKNKVTETPI